MGTKCKIDRFSAYFGLFKDNFRLICGLFAAYFRHFTAYFRPIFCFFSANFLLIFDLFSGYFWPFYSLFSTIYQPIFGLIRPFFRPLKFINIKTIFRRFWLLLTIILTDFGPTFAKTEKKFVSKIGKKVNFPDFKLSLANFSDILPNF